MFSITSRFIRFFFHITLPFAWPLNSFLLPEPLYETFTINFISCVCWSFPVVCSYAIFLNELSWWPLYLVYSCPCSILHCSGLQIFPDISCHFLQLHYFLLCMVLEVGSLSTLWQFCHFQRVLDILELEGFTIYRWWSTCCFDKTRVSFITFMILISTFSLVSHLTRYHVMVCISSSLSVRVTKYSSFAVCVLSSTIIYVGNLNSNRSCDYILFTILMCFY